MYVYLGQNTVVKKSDILAVFDLDKTTVSKKTRDFLYTAQKKNQVVNVAVDLPKSFVVTWEKEKSKIYICQIAPSALRRRLYQ